MWQDVKNFFHVVFIEHWYVPFFVCFLLALIPMKRCNERQAQEKKKDQCVRAGGKVLPTASGCGPNEDWYCASVGSPPPEPPPPPVIIP